MLRKLSPTKLLIALLFMLFLNVNISLFIRDFKNTLAIGRSKLVNFALAVF